MLWVQLLQTLGEDATMLNAKVEDMGEWLAEKLRVDRRLVRPKQERDQMQKGMGQLLAQRMQGGAPQPQPGGAPAPAPSPQLPLAA